eukprot:1182417-Amorphochlora_amoeboformis.AAC.3
MEGQLLGFQSMLIVSGFSQGAICCGIRLGGFEAARVWRGRRTDAGSHLCSGGWARDDPREWHKENIRLNIDHYSVLSTLGLDVVW